MKLICIKPLTFKEWRLTGANPLKYFEEYEVDEILNYPKGLGYTLKGIDNSNIQVVKNGQVIEGAKFCYHCDRFIQISEIENLKLEYVYNT